MTMTQHHGATAGLGAPAASFSTRTRVLAGLALSLLSGLLAVWSLEDYHVPALVWVALVPGLVAQHRVLPRRWSGLGLGITVGVLFQGYLGPGLSNADLPWYLYVYGVWIGLFIALLSMRSRSFHEATRYRWFLIATPLAWIGIDFVRSQMTEVFGGTWGFLAYALYERPALIQPVSVFGVYGLQLLILVVNFALALAAIGWFDRRYGPTDGSPAVEGVFAGRRLMAAGLILALWVGASLAMMRDPEPTITVAAVQPGSHDAGRQHSIPAEEELARDLAQTAALKPFAPDLVVWREAGIRFDPRKPQGEQIRQTARELGAHLAVGWQEPVGTGRYNEVAAFSPDGKALGSYGKSHPGEFAGDFSARQGEYLVYDTPWGRFGSIICFDLDFTDSARNVARLGANVLAVSSNDVTGIAEKHYTHLVFRAIETRQAVVKADSAYDSAIIDPYGRILARQMSKQGSRTTLVADVPIGSGDTLYVRFGDWLPMLALGLSLLLALAATVRWRRAR